MIHKLLLFLCRSTRTKPLFLSLVFSPMAWMEMKETEERGERQGDAGNGLYWALVRLSKLVGRGSECITKRYLTHTRREKKKEAFVLSCLV